MRPNIICVHGAYSNHKTFDKFIEAYQDSYLHDFGFSDPRSTFGQIWAPDLRGHGKSLPYNEQPYSIRSLGNEVHAFVDSVGIKRNPNLFIGHGLGGLCLLDHWIDIGRFGYGGIIVDAQPGMNLNPYPKVLGKTFSTINQWISYVKENYFPQGYQQDIGNLVMKSLSKRNDGSYAWAVDPLFNDSRFTKEVSDRLWKKLKDSKPNKYAKIVFLRGGNSPFTDHDDLRELITMMNESKDREWAYLEEIGNAGHYLHEENPKVLAKAVRDYFVPVFEAQTKEEENPTIITRIDRAKNTKKE